MKLIEEEQNKNKTPFKISVTKHTITNDDNQLHMTFEAQYERMIKNQLGSLI